MNSSYNDKHSVVLHIKDLFQNCEIDDCYALGNTFAFKKGFWILEVDPSWRILDGKMPLFGSNDVGGREQEETDQSSSVFDSYCEVLSSFKRCRIEQISINDFFDFEFVMSNGMIIQKFSDIVLDASSRDAALLNLESGLGVSFGCGFVEVRYVENGPTIRLT